MDKLILINKSIMTSSMVPFRIPHDSYNLSSGIGSYPSLLTMDTPSQ